MTTTTPPLGYSNLLNPESLEDVYRTNRIVDKSVSLVKSAIQEYLDGFLNPNGYYRKYLTSTVSAEGLQYVTELSYDEEMKVRPNLRKTMLAKYFAENTNRFPSILIIDQGVEPVDVGINNLVEGFSFANKWRASLLCMSKITLSVSVATYSQEDTTTLANMVLFIFDTLSDLLNRKIIRGVPKSQWEIRLPLTGYTAGQISNVPVEQDNKSQVWMRSVDFTVDFETLVKVQLPMPQYQLVPPTVANNPDDPQPVVLNLTPNQAIPLGTAYPLLIQNFRANQYIGTSDPNIALVTSEPPFILQPRRQGQALLYIFTYRKSQSQDLETGEKRNLILDIPFRVTT